MKNDTITFRIQSDLKLKLDEIAHNKEKTYSDLIRPLINNMISENKITSLGNERVYKPIEDNLIIHSLDFTELIFWIFDKKIDPEANEIESFYSHLVKVIDKIKSSKFFEKEFIHELNKVQKELKFHLENEDHDCFIFAVNGEFDFEVFRLFMHTLRFDADDKIIIQNKII